ncbi:DUF4214 domain-containing protein [Acidisphaera sp. L21]|uniref:DUF4214 domain-containing protein n=1 Tax=Acidisphaera sp. L21 TaxID=1641851 RepID=UPI00131C6D0C|nr:DUF4214 domain-containing protein [Acidisphaera sp. L21]
MPTSANEQYLLELINDARMNPLGDAARYISSYTAATSSQADVQSALTQFGVDGVRLLAAFQALTPSQPVAFSDVLAGGALAHNQAMIATDTQAHQTTGEAGLAARLTNEGYAFRSAGENIYAYSEDPLFAQAAFMVDWGGDASSGGMQAQAGHRVNETNSSYREIGLSIVDTTQTSSTSVGPEVVTEDFATTGTAGSFLLGVAYDDTDKNGFYSVGEGVAGLTVSVGGATTTSTASGGYTLATSLIGTQTVTLSGAGLAGSVQVKMALTDTSGNGLNAKLDVIDGAILHLSNSGVVTGAVSTIAALGLQALTIAEGDAIGRTLIGNDGGDTMTGGAGNDVITGGAGNDVIDGGLGINTLNGGTGINTIVFDFASTAATIAQTGSNWTISTQGVTDTITNFAKFQFTDKTLTALTATTAQIAATTPVTTTSVTTTSATTTSVTTTSAITTPATTTSTTPASPVAASIRTTTITGTSGNDVFNDTTGNQTYIGNGGNDTLNLADGRRGATFSLLSDGTISITHDGQTDAIKGISTVNFIDGSVTFDPNSNAAAVTRLYTAALGRTPDQAGLAFWTDALQHGTALSTVAAGFLNAPEYAARLGATSNSNFVTQIYQNVLGRAPDAAGQAFWTSNLNTNAATRSQVLASISESAENKTATASQVSAGIWTVSENAAEVARLYDTAFGRTPDLAGLTFWTSQIASGAATASQVANALVGSQEFQATYGQLGDRDFVDTLYTNTLHRSADAAGETFWTNALGSNATRAQVAIGISDSPEHQSLTAANILGSDASSYGIKFS